MSQYPPPFPAPESSPDELLRPARRAGALMIALGVLFVAGGLCNALIAFVLRSPDLMGPDVQQQVEEIEGKLGGSEPVLRNLIVQGAVLLGVGAALGALGMLVRGGRRRPVIVSIVVCAVLAVFAGLSTLGTLLGGAVYGMAAGQVFTGLCIGTVVLCLLALLIVWLIQALRGEGRLAHTRQQYEEQLAYYQQQQQYFQRQPHGQPAQHQPPPTAGPLPPPIFQPPASAGGYHQYPTAPPVVSTPPTAPPPGANPGDPPDGPSAQG